MRIRLLVLVLFSATLFSCQRKEKNFESSIDKENWENRRANIKTNDSLVYGKSYLSVYSQIYDLTHRKTHNLTAMISMRNMSETDTIYVIRAEYFGTKGNSVRKYFDAPIYLLPMETTDIVIEEIDNSGGTGSNFIFEWKTPKGSPEPLFEGVMSSTLGQQGLSFTTHAKRIK